MREAAAAAGRAPSDVSASLLAIYGRVGEEMKNADGDRLTFTGSAQAVIDDIAAYRDIGLSHFLIGGDAATLSEATDRMENFASNVMAAF